MNRVIILTSRHKRKITITVDHGIIKSIVNESGIRFPFSVGQLYNRSIETWSERNDFLFNGEDLEKKNRKVCGVRIKDVPKGHVLRLIYPEKFR